MKQIIIYQSSFCSVGGVETFIYNWCWWLRNFYDVTKHSSDAYTYFPYKNKYFVNRHTIENRHENMECGHPYTSCCYLDSDKCSHCDCEHIIKFGNKE